MFIKMLEIEYQIKKHEHKKSENRQTEVQREINEEREREVWGMLVLSCSRISGIIEEKIIGKKQYSTK